MKTNGREDRETMTKDITNIRSTLEWLKTQGDVIETDKEVDPDLQLTGLQKHLDGGHQEVLDQNTNGP